MGNCLSRKPKKQESTDSKENVITEQYVQTNHDHFDDIRTKRGSQISNNDKNHIALDENKRKYLNSGNNSDTVTTVASSRDYGNDQTAPVLFNNIPNETTRNERSTSRASDNNNNNQNKKYLENIFVCIYDYDARTTQDLTIKKGDILYIDESDKTSNGWWSARLIQRPGHNTSSSIPTINIQQIRKEPYTRGYVPSQYVAPINSLDAFDWYFGHTKRYEAEELLKLDINQHGSFLVRTSDGVNHAFSLSVRDKDMVKHYRIRVSEDSRYFIARKTTFDSLNALVAYYTKQADGLSVQLMKPCIKTEKPVTQGLTHSFMNSYEINRDLIGLKKIGQGQFGDVWLAEFKINKMQLAVKTLKEGMNPAEFKAEAELMMKLSHPKLIQLYGLCTKFEPIWIITELMINGSLLDYLQTQVGKNLKLDILIYIASQIADGMAYLESRRYIHRDLAARNVLVGEKNEVKVADFGLARVVKDAQNIYNAKEGTKFPIKWTAPEAAIQNKFSIKSDVWSFGIVLSEIVTYGRTPYPTMTNQEVLQQVSRSYRMPKPPNCPDRLYQFMLNCWKQDPESRPTFESLKYKLESYFDEDENAQYRDANGGNNRSASQLNGSK